MSLRRQSGTAGIFIVSSADRHQKRAVRYRLGPDASGAAAMEYALLVSLVAVAIVGSLILTGNSLSASMNKVERAETLTIHS